MLLYNQRKEFIGIDEDDLSALDFQNINELQNESHDFADLFVKKPGYIHNFKNFSWIDFILHSETDESKAIIHAKGRNYSCALHITPFHFSSDDSGYAVIIRNLRALKGAEDEQASKDLQSAGGIQATPAPAGQTAVPSPAAVSMPAPDLSQKSMPELDISLDDIKLEEAPKNFTETTEDFGFNEPELELPNFEQSQTQELNEPDPLDIPEPQNIDLGLSSPSVNEFGAPVDIDYNAPLDINEDLMIDNFEEPVQEEVPAAAPIEDSLAVETSTKQEAPMLGDYVSTEGSEHLSELVRSGDYVYDPGVAANELGLPVDLIEEFIGDFIDQAHEFHDDLFASVNAGDFDNVQILSHKLKGVAANLRVEDAFDVLSVVNVSKEVEEILPNLNQFYKIIAKLEGKEIPEPAPAATPEPTPEPVPEAPAPVEEEIDYNIGIKAPDDGPMLVDEDVPAFESDDDLYGDLLGTPEPVEHDDVAMEPAPQIEEDIYDDLLGSPEAADTTFETEATLPPMQDDDIYDDLLGAPDSLVQEEAPVADLPDMHDDIYDDMLGSPDNDLLTEPQSSPAVDVPALNIDVQKSANELGIPLDIVKDFIQEFKEQLNLHHNDFTSAVQDQNIQQINKTATLLKGMSDNLRLSEISEVLKGLQIEQDINNTAEAIATLQAYADQL